MGWGIHVNPWLIHVNIWQKPLQYCKVISLQLIKINGKKKKKRLWKERIQIMQDFVGQIKLLKVIERRTIELELH